MLPNIPIERVVVLLTPVFAAAATWLAALVASNVPGAPHLDPGAIEGIEIAAFLGATGIVGKWLHGRQIPAIAQLAPTQQEKTVIEQAAARYLAEHAQELVGLQGSSGVTQDQARALAREEIGRIVAAGAATPSASQ